MPWDNGGVVRVRTISDKRLESPKSRRPRTGMVEVWLFDLLAPQMREVQTRCTWMVAFDASH